MSYKKNYQSSEMSEVLNLTAIRREKSGSANYESVPNRIPLFDPLEIDIDTVYYEISGICNAKCAYCPTGSGVTKGHQSRFIPPDEFAAGLNRLYELELLNNDQFFGLYNWGDPLLHPKLEKILEILKEADQKFALSTNGSFFPKKIDKSLLENLTSLRLSLPGFSQESYDRIHQLPFKTILDNIDSFADIVPKNLIEVGIFAYKFNIDEIFTAVDYFNERNIKISVTMPCLMDWDDAIDYLKENMIPEKKQRIENDLFTDYLKPMLFFKENNNSCKYLQNQLVIDEFNNILTCCVLSKNSKFYSLGSLFELTRDEIFRFKRQGQPICRKCVSVGVPYWYDHAKEYLPQELKTCNNETYCYIDTGNGFSENQKVTFNISTKILKEHFFVHFDLGNFNEIKSLRWDPIEMRLCRIKIKDIIITNSNGETKVFDLLQLETNGERISETEFIFSSSDPRFIFPIEEQIKAISISGEWSTYRESETISIQNQTITLQNQTIILQNQTIILQNRKIQYFQRIVGDLREKIGHQAIQLEQFSIELSSVKQSIMWHGLMKFHKFIEIAFPHGTRSRRLYDLGLRGGRILVNEGYESFLYEIRQFFRFRKKIKRQSASTQNLNHSTITRKFSDESNEENIPHLLLKYIRGRGVCIGTDAHFLGLPKNIDVIYTDPENYNDILKDSASINEPNPTHRAVSDTYNKELEKYDFCLIWNILNQIEDPKAFFENCLESLNVGGTLCLVVDDRSSPKVKTMIQSISSSMQCGCEANNDSGFLDSNLRFIEIGDLNYSQKEIYQVFLFEKSDYLEKIENLLEKPNEMYNVEVVNLEVIIPVYNAYDDLLRCLYSVLKYQGNYRVFLINDCSSDERIINLFSRLKAIKSERLVLLENDQNLGFVKTVNKGMKYSNNDVILLNSDTIVTSNWSTKIKRCAYSDKDIATVTPFTNNGTICSIPVFCDTNDIPVGFTIDSFAWYIDQISFRRYPEIPTAVGFCMYIKREVLNSVGYFDEETFGKGYGEENDFCMRAKYHGYKHALCDDTFVFHRGEASFSERKSELCSKNLKILSQKYPEYLPNVHSFIESNPLKELQENIQIRVGTWNLNKNKKKILFILHTSGGGTEKHVRDLITSLKEYCFYVLQVYGSSVVLTEVNNGQEMRYNFPLKEPLEKYAFSNDGYNKILSDIIDTYGIDLIHIHHLIGHSFDIVDIARLRNIPLFFTAHDFYSICPNINLIDSYSRLCDGNIPLLKCDTCLQKTKQLSFGFAEKWRTNFNRLLKSCELIFCPSFSASEILSSHYPDIKSKIVVIEHGIDKKMVDNRKTEEDVNSSAAHINFHIGYIGGLSFVKGKDIFYKLACSRELKNRVNWSIFGISDTHDKIGFYSEYNVTIHGPYEDFYDLKNRVEKENINLMLFPAIWPETFSYTLSEVWALGIPVIVSGLGALKDRVNKCGGGWIINEPGINEFKEKILEIINSPDDYMQKKREVMNIPLRTTTEMAEEYRSLYNRFLDKKGDYSRVCSTISNYLIYRSIINPTVTRSPNEAKTF